MWHAVNEAKGRTAVDPGLREENHLVLRCVPNALRMGISERMDCEVFSPIKLTRGVLALTSQIPPF